MKDLIKQQWLSEFSAESDADRLSRYNQERIQLSNDLVHHTGRIVGIKGSTIVISEDTWAAAFEPARNKKIDGLQVVLPVEDGANFFANVA